MQKNQWTFIILNEINQGIIILDSMLKIQFWNQYLENLTGISSDKVFNKKIDEILDNFKDPFLSNILLDTLKSNQKLFMSAALHNHFTTLDTDTLKQNMKLIAFEKEGEKYLLVEIEDVTCSYLRIQQLKENIIKLKELQKSLDRSERRYRMLFENIDKPFIYTKVVADAQGSFQEFLIFDANFCFLKLIGSSKAEVIGKGLIEVFTKAFSQDSFIEKFKRLGKYAVKQLPCVAREIYLDNLNKYFSVSGYCSKEGDDMEGCSYAIIFTDITAQKENECLMEYMAYHDSLTGLSNRKFFEQTFSQHIQEAGRQQERLALLFIDIDEFKRINDLYGHHFGDKYLAEISKKIARHLRDCDQIARYGGDEFLVLMSSVRDEAHCISLIEQFLKKMEPFQTIEGIDLTPQLSIGIALYPDDGKTYEELLKKADSAMYKAKKKSGNNYSF